MSWSQTLSGELDAIRSGWIPTNRRGVTLCPWLDSAGIDSESWTSCGVKIRPSDAYDAWKAGTDPDLWAARFRRALGRFEARS